MTLAGPVSQTGGVTLPSMTTWPAFSPPNAAATDDRRARRGSSSDAHQVGADAFVALVSVHHQPAAQRADVERAPVLRAGSPSTAAAWYT